MRRRFIYFHLLKTDSYQLKEILPIHRSYWENLKLKNFMWGEFADGSGGLVTFDAPNREQAEEIIAEDPLFDSNALEEKWIKELIVE